MMPDIVVQPKPAQAPAKGSSGSRMVRSAMQKAANQGDSASQVASPGANAAQKQPAEKSAEPAVPFFDLLMAQMEVPADVVVVPAQMPEAVAAQAQVQAAPQAQAAVSLSESAPQTDVQVAISQALKAATQTGQAVSVQPAVAGSEPVVPGAETPLPQASEAPLTAKMPLEMAAAPAQSEVVPKHQVLSQNRAPIAQPVVEATVKNTSQDSGAKSESHAKLPQQAPNMGAIAPESASATEEVASAKAFAAQMASRQAAKQTPNISSIDKSAQAFLPTTQAPNPDSGGLLESSAAGLTGIRQIAATDFDNSAQTATTQTATQTAAQTAADTKFLANQVAEGLRSAVGSDRTVTITLNPPELGRVFIRLQEDNGSVNAVLKVENPVTRADIEQSIPSIVRSLEQSGITVRRMDVQPSDPVPQQEGSSGRQYDMQGGMPNQRDPNGNPSAQGSTSAGNPWQDLQTAAASAAPVSIVSDSAINIYV